MQCDSWTQQLIHSGGAAASLKTKALAANVAGGTGASYVAKITDVATIQTVCLEDTYGTLTDYDLIVAGDWYT